MFDGGAARMHGLHQRQEAQVKTQHLVFCVVGDPGNLVRVQARVDGMQDPARATHAVIDFKVAIAVPGQRGNPVAKRQLQPIQRIGHFAGALR